MFNQVIAGMGRAAEGEACLLKHSVECTEKKVDAVCHGHEYYVQTLVTIMTYE